MSRGEICWPLGLRPSGPDDPACLERRSAWILNQTAPPTFADPLYQGKLRFSYYTNREHTARLRPGCEERGMQLVQAIRWPALLEPWLSPEQRRSSSAPPWSSACNRQESAGHTLTITGLRDGTVLRRAADGSAPLVELRTRGAGSEVFWLINGRLVAQTRAGEAYTHRFTEQGEYGLTAMDGQGAYSRINVVVQ